MGINLWCNASFYMFQLRLGDGKFLCIRCRGPARELSLKGEELHYLNEMVVYLL